MESMEVPMRALIVPWEGPMGVPWNIKVSRGRVPWELRGSHKSTEAPCMKACNSL